MHCFQLALSAALSDVFAVVSIGGVAGGSKLLQQPVLRSALDTAGFAG